MKNGRHAIYHVICLPVLSKKEVQDDEDKIENKESDMKPGNKLENGKFRDGRSVVATAENGRTIARPRSADSVRQPHSSRVEEKSQKEVESSLALNK